ncbi:MAG: biotin transporter BioY [Methanomicrobiaceae archaeon]|nr:biotin transporter BioY [Methanomicrobiaceae archaeon]
MFGHEERSFLVSSTAAFIALITAGAWVSVPFFPVPLTLQTLFVLLSGVVMKRTAIVPAALYVVLGAMGLPVFHNGLAGLGVLLGPTGGYILGFVPAALICGYAYQWKGAAIRVAGILAAVTVIYACGLAWLMYSASLALPQALFFGVLIFLPGEALKVAAAYLIGARIE